jgi:hypothetical protein
LVNVTQNPGLGSLAQGHEQDNQVTTKNDDLCTDRGRADNLLTAAA